MIEAARRLYEKDSALARNDSETARRILGLKLPALNKGGQQQIGVDAITRHFAVVGVTAAIGIESLSLWLT